MKIWFTRPSTWDILVRGVYRCTLWLQKPFFDTTPLGEEREIPLYAHFPVGWCVVDPMYGDITSQVSISVKDVIDDGQFDPVIHALWDAACRSVDGKGPDEEGGALVRFGHLLDDIPAMDVADLPMSSFVFEYDAPPELWFKAAEANGLEVQTAAGQWAQREFPLDTEMGIEAPEPPPVKNPVVLYDGPEVRVAII